MIDIYRQTALHCHLWQLLQSVMYLIILMFNSFKLSLQGKKYEGE